jgi:1-acyl-sn-glycerol-3-phosphate acyltransferase
VVLIRSLIYFILMVVTILLFGLTLSLMGWLMPMSWREAISNAWGRTNLFLQNAVCGLSYTMSGTEHIPAGGAIIMSKHQSSWETIALRGILPCNQAWVLKRELMWVPVFGWALAVLKPIAIDRKAGRKAMKLVVEQGQAALASGRNVIIFPEGTRTAPGEHRRYNVGGGLLAAKTGAPVVPIAHNAGVFWSRRGLKKHPGTIQVVVGEAIATEGRSATDIMAEVEGWIEGIQAELPLKP